MVIGLSSTRTSFCIKRVPLHDIRSLLNEQMDLLAALPAGLPLIIPSTTMRETRHRSLPLYNRLLQVVHDESRCVWVWWNEERRETATHLEGDSQVGMESINDRNDRGRTCLVDSCSQAEPQRSEKLSNSTSPISRAQLRIPLFWCFSQTTREIANWQSRTTSSLSVPRNMLMGLRREIEIA